MARRGNLEIVKNPNRIAQKVRVIPGGSVDGLLERVESAIQNFSGEFTAIYHADVERIGKHMAQALADPEGSAVAVAAIRVSLHDLRGQGGTFGYDLVTRICDSGCKFIDLCEDFGRTELMVLNMHVDALRAVKQKDVRGQGGQTGIDLMEGQRAIVIRHREGTLDESRLAETS